MIESFADPETEKIFKGLASRQLPPDIQKTARRKLLYFHSASDLRDLLAPPGNRPEELRGDRAGQHSVRINDPWRICCRWVKGNARDVAAQRVDYH